MFSKIEIIVEDKKVGEACRALLGISRGVPHVTPIVNMLNGGGDTAHVAETNGGLLSMFAAWLRKSHKSELTPAELKEWLSKNGRSGGSASYLAQQAMKAGVLRRTGKSSKTVYHTVKHEARK